MDTFLHVLKVISNRLFLAIFSILLITLVTAQVVFSNVTNPTTVKGWLADAQVYDQVPEILLNSPVTEDKKSIRDIAQENDQLDEQELEETFSEALPPTFLQAQVEGLIDAIHVWYEQEDTPLNYTINLSERKDDFKVAFKQLVEDTLRGLPVCSAEQLRQQVDERDALSADCRPPGVNIEAEAVQVSNEFINEASFFDEGLVVEAKPFNQLSTKEQEGTQENSGPQPTMIKGVIKTAPTVLFVSLLVLAGLIFATSDSWKRGVRSMGTVLVVDGILLLIGWLVLFNLIKPESISLGGSEDGLSSETLHSLFDPLFMEMQSTLVSSATVLSGAITIMGIALISWYFLHWRSHHEKHHDNPENSKPKDKLPKPKKN